MNWNVWFINSELEDCRPEPLLYTTSKACSRFSRTRGEHCIAMAKNSVYHVFSQALLKPYFPSAYLQLLYFLQGSEQWHRRQQADTEWNRQMHDTQETLQKKSSSFSGTYTGCFTERRPIFLGITTNCTEKRIVPYATFRWHSISFHQLELHFSLPYDGGKAVGVSFPYLPWDTVLFMEWWGRQENKTLKRRLNWVFFFCDAVKSSMHFASF